MVRNDLNWEVMHTGNVRSRWCAQVLHDRGGAHRYPCPTQGDSEGLQIAKAGSFIQRGSKAKEPTTH
jgi:hypothetical protein